MPVPQVLCDNIELDGLYLLSLENHHLNPENISGVFCCHHDLEISYVKSGTGKYLTDNKIYDIRKGDIFIFNNIEPHAICAVDPGPELVNMVIMFDPRFIWSIESNLFDVRYLDIFFERNEFFQNRLDRDNPATKEIERLFLEIETEFFEKLPEYQLMIKVKLLNILVALTRHYGYTGREAGGSSKRTRDLALINRVVDYININLSNDIRLEDMACIAPMNPSYFSRFFKKYMGMGPSDYISKNRISRALEYLKNTDKTILEIACLCGFNNTANFNKTFKKIIGKVPSEFRWHPS